MTRAALEDAALTCINVAMAHLDSARRELRQDKPGLAMNDVKLAIESMLSAIWPLVEMERGRP